MRKRIDFRLVGMTGPVVLKMACYPTLISVDGRARLPDAPLNLLTISAGPSAPPYLKSSINSFLQHG
ncbi:MAG: hypothetical protein A2283_03545 [Lentisphaerae bacterium RIFOXYA12_FULL_48_11]|nr:MAG: hypothetical protein A2283_03545 [Lentisphaerae bacterium RIFOXYA12_FULL_48_11]